MNDSEKLKVARYALEKEAKIYNDMGSYTPKHLENAIAVIDAPGTAEQVMEDLMLRGVSIQRISINDIYADAPSAEQPVETVVKNSRLGESLLRPAISAANQLPAGCYCKEGQCGAPRKSWCRDTNKRDGIGPKDIAATPTPAPTPIKEQ